MIALYQFGNSVCCQKVRITMKEKRLSWEAVEVNLFRNEQYDPKYLQLNPKGVVPTIVHDGRAIVESTLICEYLDDVFPQPSLIPSDPLLRTHMRLWSKMVDESLHEGISEISFCAMFRERMRKLSPEQREIRFRNVGDPRRRDRFKSTFDTGTQSPFVLHAVAAYEKMFKMLEVALAEGGPWILGPSPSLADINLMPYVARLEFLGLADLWTNQRPHVQAWWDRVQKWHSYQAGIVEPMAPAELAEMQTHGPKIRTEIAALLKGLRADQAQLQSTAA
jgi:glutathione S-transferase